MEIYMKNKWDKNVQLVFLCCLLRQLAITEDTWSEIMLEYFRFHVVFLVWFGLVTTIGL